MQKLKLEFLMGRLKCSEAMLCEWRKIKVEKESEINLARAEEEGEGETCHGRAALRRSEPRGRGRSLAP